MTDQAVPPRNLDSQSVRRIALRIHAEGDYLVDAVNLDALGDLTPSEAHHVLSDAMDRLNEILRDIRPLRRMTGHAAVMAALAEQRKP